jgi:hypothetical protein
MPPGVQVFTPWVYESLDYVGKAIRITVNFDNTTRALTNAVVHRDTGCQYRTIVFDNPSDQAKAKRLAAPNDGQGDRTYTSTQLASQGLSTIEQALAIQITAEP